MKTKLKMIFAFILLTGISACSSDDNSTNSDDYDNPNNAIREKVKIDVTFSGNPAENGSFIQIYSWITKGDDEYIVFFHDKDDYQHYVLHSEDFTDIETYNLHTKEGVEGVTIMTGFPTDHSLNDEYNVKIYTDKKVLDERVIKKGTTSKVIYTVLVE